MEDVEEEGGGGEGWLVSYADLMTLLFAAFVVLYGITPQGESDEIVGIASSIRESFIEIPDQIEDPGTMGPSFAGKFSFKAVDNDSPSEKYIKKFNRDSNDLKARDERKDEIEILTRNLKRKGDGLYASLRKATEVSTEEFGVSLRLMGKSYFEHGKTTLSTDGRVALMKLGEELKRLKRPIWVEGHTDSGSTGTDLSNLEIAALRASHVRKLLIREVGLDESLIQTATYGEILPIASNSTSAGRSRNRRVEIKIRM